MERPDGTNETNSAATKTFGNVKLSTWLGIELAALIFTGAVVWGLFALPTVFYLIEPSSTQANSSTAFETKCTAVLYNNTGSVCYQYLEDYKSCIPSLSLEEGVYISSSINVMENEAIADKAKQYERLLSPQCRGAALPFFCLYLFPLCDGNQTAYLPSSEQCTTISTETCKNEWTLAKATITDLPECSALPNISPCNRTIPSSLGQSPLMNSNCSENFVFIRNSCLPECPNWVIAGTDATNSEDAFVQMAVVVGLVSGVLTVVISALRHKRMFVFPSILVFYQTVITVLLAVFAAVSRINPKALYCTSPDWIESFKQSTPFCAISGSLFFYCLMLLAIIWICHVAVVFWGIKCPLHANSFKNLHRMKYVHAAVVLLAITLSVVPVAAAFASGGFVNARFPPLLCLPQSVPASFYALVLPISIILPIGVSLLLALFWTIHKPHILQIHREGASAKLPELFGTAERKIIIVFLYYVLIGVISLAAFVLNARVHNIFPQKLEAYFACESATPGKCDDSKSEVLKYINPGINDAAFSLVALFPLVNLVYAINFDNLKQIFCSRCHCKKASKGTSTSMHKLMVHQNTQDLQSDYLAHTIHEE